MLTEAQVLQFKTFGYLLLKGLFSPSEVKEITEMSDAILADDRQGLPFANEKRQTVYGCVEKHPKLINLLEDDRVYRTVEQVLGEHFVTLGSETCLYVGDTNWHPDWHLKCPKVKFALYLDPVDKDSGCLRVLPGSHLPEFHDMLHPGLLQKQLGLDPINVPSVPLESEPGDVVMFNMRVFHSSFKGKPGRRMLAMNFSANPETPEDVEAYRNNYASVLELVKQLSSTPATRVFDDSYLHSEKPRLKSMNAKLVEYNLL